MRNDIQKILEIAVQAPSGENAQPWKFGVRGDKVHVFNIPERDQSPYNFRQRGSFVAHGALLENISIVSSQLGYETNFVIFPDKNDRDLIAVITLKKTKPKEESLYAYIVERATNRKPYDKTLPLTARESHEILNAAQHIKTGRVLITENKENIRVLSLVGSMNERLALENKYIHDFLFSHINWTEEENQEKKLGFDIKTLELPGPAKVGFKLFSYWPILRVLNIVGASKAVWKQNGSVYAASSAVGIITVKGSTSEDFINAGRIMQRVWLTSTSLGLSFQPMTGILFFMQRLLADTSEPFSAHQIELIKESYEAVQKIFNIQNETIPVMFRIGHGAPPTAQALKLKPIIDFIE